MRLSHPHRSRRLLVRSVAVALLLVPATVPLSAYAQSSDRPARHVVQPGEVLWQIARDVGVDAGAILRLNGLEDGDRLVVGQTLALPEQTTPRARGPEGEPAAAAAAAAADPALPTVPAAHVVSEGDTLWLVAQRYGTTVEALTRANALERPDQLEIGTRLALPAEASATPASPAEPPAASQPAGPPATPAARGTLTVFYTVREGDTLGGIASQTGASIQAIAEASALVDLDRLAVGTVLKVPVRARERVVQAGETLYGIAQREQVDLGALIDFNEIADPGRIREGAVLLVPAVGPRTAASLSAAQASAAPPAADPAAPAAREPSAPSAPAATSAAPTPASPSQTPSAAATAPAARPTGGPASAPPPAPARAAEVAAPARPQAVALPPGVAREGIVGQAAALLGRRYVFGGSGPDVFDCSGLVWYVARAAGTPVPRGLLGQFNSGTHPAREALKPGDLVFFQNTYMPGLSHNGVYIGNGQFISAADESTGVVVSRLDSPYWASRWFGATRIGGS